MFFVFELFIILLVMFKSILVNFLSMKYFILLPSILYLYKTILGIFLFIIFISSMLSFFYKRKETEKIKALLVLYIYYFS